MSHVKYTVNKNAQKIYTKDYIHSQERTKAFCYLSFFERFANLFKNKKNLKKSNNLGSLDKELALFKIRMGV